MASLGDIKFTFKKSDFIARVTECQTEVRAINAVGKNVAVGGRRTLISGWKRQSVFHRRVSGAV